MNKIRLLVAISGLLAGFLLISHVYAAEQGARESITLSPTEKEYTVNAGDTRQDEITLLNDGEVDYDIKMYARPFSVQGESYAPLYSTHRPNTDISNWIKTEKSTYKIAAGQTTKVPYTLKVPEGAKPGSHYGVIFAETVSSTPNTTGVARQKRVGSLLYLTVNGSYRSSGELLGSNSPFFQFNNPLEASVRVRNTGNVDFMTNVDFKINNIFGSEKFSEQKDYRVLAETTRKIPLKWQQSPKFGLYKVSITTKYLETQKTDSSYVLMAPTWFYLVVPLLILVAIIFFVQRRR